MKTASPEGAVADNPVVRENRRPGTTSWAIPWSGHALADDVGRQVKGYSSRTSVNAGEPISFMVHTSSTGRVAWNVYRLGWYGGAGARQVAGGSAAAWPRPAGAPDPVTGMIRCTWPATVTVSTTSWISGIHVAVLTSGNHQNYVPFTVRDDARPAKMLVLQGASTYQAYNNYPNDRARGKSLYAYNSYGKATAGGSVGAVKVSFDRPYADHGASTLFQDCAPVARYLEARGYDVKYATDVDLHARPGLLDGVRCVVSAGHHEYYSAQMFTAAEGARDAGTGLSFLGGNDVYWQIRFEDGDRTVVCWRDAGRDPEADPALETIRFRDTGRVEQRLLGAMWPILDGAGLVGPPAAWVVSDGSHWIYRGTGLVTGSAIGNLVGVEADRRLPDEPGPVAGRWDVLASSPFTTRSGGKGLHEATIYQAPSGAWVFDAGTLNYANGVGGAGTSDAGVQAMSTNLLTRQTGATLSATTARASGATRYDTAVEASRRTFPAAFGGTVHVTTGLDFPDALAASAATRGHGPVLLVPGNSLPDAVRDELVRLEPAAVVVVGGPGAVTDDVLDAVRTATGITPQRVAGADRYATAAALSAATFAPGANVAYVATGTDFPDALAAGAAGAQLGGPVLLTHPTTLPDATATELRRLEPQRIVVAGGSSAVSDGVVSVLSRIAATTRRCGADRYATAIAIARDARGASGGGSILLATGETFPDALAAGPTAAATGGTLVLVPRSLVLPVPTAEEIVRNDPSEILAIGDDSAVPQALLDAAGALLDPVDGTGTLGAHGGTVPPPPAPAPAPGPALPEPTGEPLPPDLERLPDPTLPWLDHR